MARTVLAQRLPDLRLEGSRQMQGRLIPDPMNAATLSCACERTATCFEGAENLLEKPEQLRVIAFTAAVPGDAVVVREGLEPEWVKKLAGVFSELHQFSEGEDFLMLAGIDRFVPTDDEDYDAIADVLKNQIH